MTCHETVDLLAAYLDGELRAGDRSRVAGHLAGCPQCAAYLDSYRDTMRLAKGAAADPDDSGATDLPEGLVKAIVAARRKA